MTRDDFQRLHELQGIDKGIDQREALLAEADDGSDALSSLEAARAALEALQEDLRQKQSRQRKLELDLETILADRKTRSDLCYGGTIGDPKELSALQQKIAELARNADRHEDMILELLEEMEAVEAAVAEQQESIEQLARRHRSMADSYERTTSRAREETAELRERREMVVGATDEALVREYEAIRERFGGIAVAVLRDGTCTACNVAVPRVLHPMIERGTSAVRCESCRRILVIPEGEE